MAQNLQLDPTKRDYVLDKGSPVPSDRVLEAGYFALAIPQGKWLYGQPGQGSLLYTMQNTKRNTSVEQTFAAFANAAVKRQLIDRGQARGVQTTNLATSSTGTSNQVEIQPEAQSIANQFDFISVGS